MNTQKFEKLIMSLINLTGGKSDEVDDKTPLMMLMEGKMEKEALALIATGKSQPEYLDTRKRSTLSCAIENDLEKVALALIATGKVDIGQEDIYNFTPLMVACCKKTMEKVALTLIATGKSRPELASNLQNTSLIFACWKGLEAVALALLETGQSNYQAKDDLGQDALFYAKRNNMTKVIEKIESMMKPATANQIPIPTQKDYENLSLALIKFIDSNTDDPTPLIWLIKNYMSKVALTLIATGQCQFDKKTKHGNTALQLACCTGYDSVELALALTLIANDKSMPENVNNIGETALILACKSSKMQNVALALLETGKSNYQHKDNSEKNALYYAKEHNFTKVVEKINALITQTQINSKQIGSTLKCQVCENNLDKKTNVVVPCGHSEFHSDCISDRQFCPVCHNDISIILELK